MKNKKLFLPTIILGVAIFAIVVYSFSSSIALKPAITEGEFPFTITYELNGETITIDEVYKARYDQNDGRNRLYVGEIGNMGEDNTVFPIKKDETGRIELHTQFYADYMLGDADYDYFDTFEPIFYYYDAEEQEYFDEESLLSQGIKLISFEYPEPINNSFVFSHISYLTSEIILPAMVISLLALIAIIIFAKKEKELKYKAIDIISIIFDFIICFTVLPFVTLIASLIDVVGGGSEFYYQAIYFIPAITILFVAASVALRRKGYSVAAIIAEFIGPIIFAIDLIVSSALEWL